MYAQAGGPGSPSWTGGFRQTVGNLGMYNPDAGNTAQKEQRLTPLGMGCGVLVGLALIFIVVLLLVSNVGIAGGLIGGIVAFIPVPVYLFIFLWLDRYDPEPVWLLAIAFAWGGLVSVIFSFIANTTFSAIAASIFGPEVGEAMGGIISAPIFEEGSKGLGVVLIALFFRKDFDDVVDGIVYAGVVALGFAAVENVLYYGRMVNISFGALIMNFVLRGILAPFSHSMFTSMTGIGCGIARETHNKTLRIVAPIAGYILAMTLHGLWNTFATIGGSGFFILYFVVEVPLFLGFIGLLVYLVRREARIIRESLDFEVKRGLITRDQLELVVSLPKRIKWLMGSFGKWPLYSARRQFLNTASKLGLCHWHAQRAAAVQGKTQSLPLIPRYQAEIIGLRDQI